MLLAFVIIAERSLWGEGIGAAPTASPESVIVIANKSAPNSVKLANYYMEKRGIPSKNLFTVATQTGESISWKYYVDTIHNVLLKDLTAAGFVDAIPSKLRDHIGRLRYTILNNKVRYMVLCRGMPLKIREDRELEGKGVEKIPAVIRRNHASVDSEVSLLLVPKTEIYGIISNPFFKNFSFDTAFASNMIKVTRLDAPTLEGAMNLVDSALAGERSGLMGRAYVDIGGKAALGDQWMKNCARFLEILGYDLDVDESKKTFPATARFDAPAIYVGWYASNVTGPFTLPGFQFPAGAIAVHLHSYSAASFRREDSNWCAPLVSLGAAATLGNVHEPYLGYTHYLDVFVASLAAGWNLADASYCALPGLSWQAVVIGDPLYRPFKVSLDEQLEKLDTPDPPLYGQYAIVRKMTLLQSHGDIDGAIAFGRLSLDKAPGFALYFKLAELYFAQDKKKEGIEVLRRAESLALLGANDWVLVKSCADLLWKYKEMDAALNIYRNLVKKVAKPKELKDFILRDGVKLAREQNEVTLIKLWENLLEK